MTRTSAANRLSRGFTLLELVIVLAILLPIFDMNRLV